MEHLTKQQIILLALLVSFVSSIATGIVVVSITEQGSQPAITQTINRVVERTIERAVTPDSANVSKETVIVRDDQAVVDAIEKSSRSVVRVFYAYGGTTETFAGLGVILSSSGTIVARIDAPAGALLTARLSGGNSVSVLQTAFNSVTGISTLQAEQSSDPLNARVYTPATFADSAEAKLGQAVIAVGGAETPRVASGILSSSGENTITSSIVDSAFDTQAILVNLSGEVLGLKIGNGPQDGFITSHNITSTYATP